MHIFDTLCPLILKFTHTLPLVFFCLIFYFWRPKNGGTAIFLLLFTMILNPFLKSIWQIPLPPALGFEGWAFPSGHMQAACAFYGWMAWQTSLFWFRGIMALLLGGIGGSLVYCGYHTPIDVVGGAFFATLTIVIYHKMLANPWVEQHLPWMGIFMTPLTLPLMFFYPLVPTPWMWMAQALLLVLSFLGIVFARFFKPKIANPSL